MLKQFQVRDLIQHDPHELFKMLPEEHVIVFEDGEVVQTTNKKTLYSSFAWEFHRQYANVPITKAHHVQHTLKGKPLNSSTHIQLLEQISKDVIFHHRLIEPIQKENVLSLIYSITNRIYNELTPYTEADVVTLDMLDFVDVLENEEIKEAVSVVTPDVRSKDDIIQQTYDKVLKILMNSSSLDNNGLSRMVRAKLANNNQVLQCIAFRGFPTEVDGTIMKEPILSNFARGNGRLYDYAAESRSAAKSHYFAEAPLEDAEYFSRRLQLLTTCITHIKYHDCGSKRYLNWMVRPPEYDENGKMIYPGDLEFLKGKLYLEPDTTELKEIMGNEKHLENRMIRMRSVLYCEEPDQHAVCATCFGALSHNVSRFANIGHLCPATLTQQTTQSVLSTKHLDASSRSADIILTPDQRTFFSITDTKNAYKLNKEFKVKDIKMVINREQAVGLADAMAFENFNSLSFERITAIEMIEFRYFDGKGEMVVPVKMGQEKRKAVFTSEYLHYLKTHRWQTDNKGNFVFEFKDWNFNIPIMMLPDMEYSYSDHSDQIAKMIESNLESLTERSKPDSPALTLQELFTKVNDKLNMNLAPLEVIMAALMIPEPGSFKMARGDANAVLGVANSLIKNRSLSNAYAFKEQVETLTAAKSFFPDNRPDSIFDVFFAPKECIDHEKRIGNLK